jgi:type II protein arginine methyltransferase
MTDDIEARFPNLAGNPLAMAMFCTPLRERDMMDEALAMGMAAIAAAPDDMQVRDLVRAALSPGVPRWHLPMLNDEARNRCYARAIERMVKPGMLVFEIGSGAGLLSLLAARAGAQVVTCEASAPVAAVAAEVFRRNGMEDRITLLRKPSTAVVPEDMPRPADLLMSELFDDTLFGDDVLTYIADAQKRLLKPGAPILPGQAALRCALVEMPARPLHCPLERVEGFDLSPLNVMVPPSAADTRVRRGAATLRSDPASALAVDFAPAGSPGVLQQRVSFRSTGGRVDGIAQWLRIDFGDDLIFDNDPFVSVSHWASRFFAFTKPVETRAGDRIEVDMRVVGTQLLMRLA